MKDVKKRALGLGAIFLALLLLDQGTKMWAVEVLKGAPPREYFHILTLVYAENMGGWGSLGASWPTWGRKMMLIVVPGAVLLGLACYLLKYETFDRWRAFGYMCIFAGGLSNLIDRVLWGYVIDFLYLGYGRLGTNIFNIADMSILWGIFLILIRSWGKEETSPSSAQPLEG